MPLETAYDFLMPSRLAFGWGRRREAGTLARSLGTRAFVITGSRTLQRSRAFTEILDAFSQAGVSAVTAGSITREPLVADVDALVASLKTYGAGPGDLLVAIGGGSAIDLAKAAGALITNGPARSVVDYLEGVGTGASLVNPPLPLIAMPTTAGTGSEATKNAVISSDRPAFKKSLRSDSLFPRIVIVDPELTVSVPPDITAWTGMDAITQLIESYVSRRAQPIPQALALRGLERAVPALEEAFRDGTSRAAREQMSQAAFLSGAALANSGLGLAHGVAAALGIFCHLPHGLACAVMLPVAMRFNLPVREAEFAKLGTVLTGRTWSSETAAGDAGLARIEELLADLKIPRRLSEIGVRADQLPDIVRGSRGNSLSGNPRDISDIELQALLETLL